MVIFETWPAARGMLPLEVGDDLERIARNAEWSDHMAIDLARASKSQPDAGFVAVWARDTGERTGDQSGDRILGYGQISSGNDVDLIEIGVDADVDRNDQAAVATEMLDATVDAQLAYHPDRDIVVWASADSVPGAAVVARATERGFVTQRVLLQMRRPLPAPAAATPTRPFDPDRDLEAVLAVNNVAFAGHPEQGGWTSETFAGRAAESWFDPDGIRLVDVDGSVAGFCWVKLHRGANVTGEIVTGEIYVVAVDPEFSGRGLGKLLVSAGMEWMVDHRATEAILYVQADNAPAIAVYERLGFAPVQQRVALWASAAGGVAS